MLRTYCVAIALILLLMGRNATAITEITETLPSGAHIRIAVPDGWQAGDGLVLYQHGFNMEFDVDPDLGPLRERQLAQGYAMAASGYSSQGWALFTAVQDNRDLLARFSQRFGTPGTLIAMGGSMGGLISHKLAESSGFEQMDGVYSLCPPAAGTRTWDTAFDLRMAYDAICEDVGGGELLNGSAPYPWAYDLNDIPDDIGDLFGTEALQQTLLRITQCTGVTLNPLFRTPPQRQRLERLMQFGGFTSEDFLVVNLAYSAFAMSDVLRAPEKLNGKNPFTSIGVDYGSDLIQSRVPAISHDPMARFDFRLSSDLFGRVDRDLKMVSVHTSRDELVRPAHQSYLRSIYPATQLLSAIVAENTHSHCGFTTAEASAGWEVLREWVETAPTTAPTFSRLAARCATLLGSGVEGPCRFDAGIDAGAVSATMRERPAQVAFTDLSAINLSGSWYDAQRSGEGLLIEAIGGDQVLVIWFTYPPAGQGEQVWLLGIGRASGHGIEVSDLRQVRGARFGSAFDPSAVQRLPWGSLRLAIAARDDVTLPGNPPASTQLQMIVDYQGPAGWGSGRRTLSQLLEIGINRQTPISPFPDPRPWQHSGIYYDPARSGEGFLVQQFVINGSWLTAVTWFTFDAAGNPMWLLGVGSVQGNSMSFQLQRPTGTQFGDDFLASEVTRTPWGQATLEFDGCDRARLSWQANDPLYGSGTLSAQRLTTPLPVWGCLP
jgi:hypothetical protein